MKKNEKKESWMQAVFLLIFIVLMLGGGYYINVDEKESLKKCSLETNGKILDVYRMRKKGYYAKYSYSVHEEKYISTQDLISITMKQMENIKIGDTYKVQYACDNYEYSKLIIP